jgi:putative ABC transport system permease protein
MQTISFSHLLYLLPPLGFVAFFYYLWVGEKTEIAMATLRMSVQLIIIGYVLNSLFSTNSLWLLALLVAIMIAVASLIARRNIRAQNFKTYLLFLVCIAVGGTLNLALVLGVVLELENPLDPRYVIPLAGMIYANAMNAISLCAERYEKEREHQSMEKARAIAFKASMIPQINSFLAVGFVSLPGMMTGQILSGIDPLIAVRYQIVVMAMILSSGAMSTILYFLFQTRMEK